MASASAERIDGGPGAPPRTRRSPTPAIHGPDGKNGCGAGFDPVECEGHHAEIIGGDPEVVAHDGARVQQLDEERPEVVVEASEFLDVAVVCQAGGRDGVPDVSHHRGLGRQLGSFEGAELGESVDGEQHADGADSNGFVELEVGQVDVGVDSHLGR